MPVRNYCYFCAAHSNLIPDLFLRKLQSIPSFLQSTYQYFENIHYARHLTYTQTWSCLAYNPQATTDEAEYYTYLGDEFFFRIYSSGFALAKSLPVALDDDEDDELEITNNILQPIVDPIFCAGPYTNPAASRSLKSRVNISRFSLLRRRRTYVRVNKQVKRVFFCLNSQ